MITDHRRALTVKEFCGTYGVGRSLLYDMIARGEVHTIKVGNKRLVPVDAAEAWLSSKIESAADDLH